MTTLPKSHYVRIGKVSSRKKSRAAKLNGKKGGRPKKSKSCLKFTEDESETEPVAPSDSVALAGSK